ncbi:Aliphatic sulfonates import ATP-binding protein SsuB [Candidatus Sulfopaludibacter sp. SbA6]|nr:Aliphatic sulfonates import ATP-binding protein SsuB [Candidatus Sulfopaludibacter sp. SbA6]
MSITIVLDHVTHVFRNSEASITALSDVCFTVAPGTRLSIVGPSGCGKSTLIALIAGLITPTQGEVRVNGSLPAPGVCAVGFQSDSVFPWLTVRDNISYGLRLRGELSPQDEQQVSEWLEATELAAFANYWPRELSGGMRKRVELARALVSRPAAIGLDEPFVSVDALTRQDLQVFLLRLLAATPMTTVLVTHDVEEAILLGTHVAVMSKRPGTIRTIIPVTLDHNRPPETRFCPEFLAIRAMVEQTLRE